MLTLAFFTDGGSTKVGGPNVNVYHPGALDPDPSVSRVKLT